LTLAKTLVTCEGAFVEEADLRRRVELSRRFKLALFQIRILRSDLLCLVIFEIFLVDVCLAEVVVEEKQTSVD
jgi:hypothetical protein